MCTYVRLLKGLFSFLFIYFFYLSHVLGFINMQRARETVWHRLRQQEQHESLKHESTLKLNINTVTAESSDSFTCRRAPEQIPVGAGGRQTGPACRSPWILHFFFLILKKPFLGHKSSNSCESPGAQLVFHLLLWKRAAQLSLQSVVLLYVHVQAGGLFVQQFNNLSVREDQ